MVNSSWCTDIKEFTWFIFTAAAARTVRTAGGFKQVLDNSFELSLRHGCRL